MILAPSLVAAALEQMNHGTGVEFALRLNEGKVEVHINSEPFVMVAPIPLPGQHWSHVCVTYDEQWVRATAVNACSRKKSGGGGVGTSRLVRIQRC